MRTAVAYPSLDKFAIFHSLHYLCVPFLHRVVSLTMKIKYFHEIDITYGVRTYQIRGNGLMSKTLKTNQQTKQTKQTK